MKKLLGIALLAVTVSAAWGLGEENNRKTVRVGYFNDEIFHIGQRDIRMKGGYGYDYYQTLTDYIPWDYEYITGTSREVYEKFLNGEVDIIADIPKTQEQKKQMLFSSFPMGNEHYFIFASNTDNSVNFGDSDFLNGKRIALDDKAINIETVKDYLKENNLNCTLVTYSGFSERYVLFQRDEADYFVGSDGFLMSGFSPVKEIGSSNFYFAVNKNRLDLVDDLDYAMAEIFKRDPNFNNQLHSKYYVRKGSKVNFEKSEYEWARNHDALKIGYRNSTMPYSGYNQKSEEVEGLIKDVMGFAASKIGIALIPVSFDDSNLMGAALLNGEVDVIFPVMDNLWLSEESGYKQTKSITSETMSIVYWGEYKGLKNYRSFGYLKGSPFQFFYIEKYALAENVKSFDSIPQMLDAVKNGVIDAFVMSTGGWSHFQKKYSSYADFKSSILEDGVGYSFGVRKDDFILLSILNMIIERMDKNQISETVAKYSQVEEVYSLKNFIKHHQYIFWGAAFAVLSAILLVGHVLHRDKNQKSYLRYASEHDGLTGVYNRTGFYRVSSQRDESKKNLCFAIVDIDDFKMINDTYGHEIGDKVIKHVSDLLVASVRSNDVVARYGGDEFIIMMYGLGEESTKVIELKAKYLNERLRKKVGDLPSITVSIGAAYSSEGYSKDLFNKADEALYDTKKRGKSNITVYA